MGKQFGELARIVGITYYTISPYEQKPLKGIFNPGIKNVLRRSRESMFAVLIPFIAGYIIITSANEEYRQLQRKDPALYADDV